MTSHDGLRARARRGTRFLAGVAFLVLGLTALAASVWAEPNSWWIHGVWCTAAVGVLFFVLQDVFAAGFEVILKDHFVMLATAFLVYFILGALLPVFGSDADIQAAFSYYPVTAIDALRVDAVNGVGFSFALLVGSVSSSTLSKWTVRRTSRLTAKIGPRLAIVAFLAIGGLAWAHVTSIDLGLRAGQASGAWRSISRLTLVGVFLGAAYRGPGERSLLAIALLATALEAGSGLVLLSKSAVLLPIAVFVAALSVRYRSQYMLLVGTAAIAVIFGSLGSYVAFGRSNLPAQIAQSDAMGIRLSTVAQGLARTKDPEFRSTYRWWSRISYLPAQTAGMNLFESDRGGEDIGRIPWLFVPRSVVPSKPSITQTSADFYTKITGRTGSYTGQGIFVSAYYNGGWLALVIISGICGWMLAQTSAMARIIVARRDAVLLPVALLGVFMAFRIDGHFISDYFGAFVLIAYLMAAGSILSTLLVTRRVRYR